MRINWKKEILTLPNLLSLLRLLMIPLYLGIYLKASHPGDYLLAGSVLAVSCLTDAIDGFVARKYNMVTNLGKLLDPFADKATQFSLTLCLSLRYPVLNPVLALFTVKEVFQLIAVIISLYNGKALPGALTAGKVCTAVLFVTLILLVLIPDPNRKLVNLVALVNAGFLTYAFACYVLAYCGKHKKLEDFRAE